MIRYYRDPKLLLEFDVLSGLQNGLNALGANYRSPALPEPTWDEVAGALIPPNPISAGTELLTTNPTDDIYSTLGNASNAVTHPLSGALVAQKLLTQNMLTKVPVGPVGAIQAGFDIGSYAGRAPSLALQKGIASVQDHAAARKLSDVYDKRYNPEMLPKRDMPGVNTAKLNMLAAADRVKGIRDQYKRPVVPQSLKFDTTAAMQSLKTPKPTPKLQLDFTTGNTILPGQTPPAPPVPTFQSDINNAVASLKANAAKPKPQFNFTTGNLK